LSYKALFERNCQQIIDEDKRKREDTSNNINYFSLNGVSYSAQFSSSLINSGRSKYAFDDGSNKPNINCASFEEVGKFSPSKCRVTTHNSSWKKFFNNDEGGINKPVGEVSNFNTNLNFLKESKETLKYMTRKPVFNANILNDTSDIGINDHYYMSRRCQDDSDCK